LTMASAFAAASWTPRSVMIHLRSDNGRISLPINSDKQTISEPAATSQKCHNG
jgi:hypothetical protein